MQKVTGKETSQSVIKSKLTFQRKLREKILVLHLFTLNIKFHLFNQIQSNLRQSFFSFFWLHWFFIAACWLSLVAASRGYSCCGVRASHCGGFSCCRARALGMQASEVVACGLSSCGLQALERRRSSCGTRA